MSQSKERAPLVYVLMLNWNGKHLMDECVSSILAMGYPNYEVVVSDNGSTDGSVAYVREHFPQVHVIENGSNLGCSGGFNAGLAYAAERGADYFLIMNNDTRIDPGALSALVATARSRPRAGFVSGKVYWHDRSRVLQTVGKTSDPVRWTGRDDLGVDEEDRGQYDEVSERAFLDVVYVLVSRELYDEIGGFDPQLFINWEGIDWQLRAKVRGWRLYYTPHARLWHYGSHSIGGTGSPFSEYFYVRNHLVMTAKHGSVGHFARLWVSLGWQRSWSLLKGIVGVLIGRQPRLRSRLAGWLGWAAGTLWLVHRRPTTRVPWLIRRLV